MRLIGHIGQNGQLPYIKEITFRGVKPGKARKSRHKEELNNLS